MNVKECADCGAEIDLNYERMYVLEEILHYAGNVSYRYVCKDCIGAYDDHQGTTFN